MLRKSREFTPEIFIDEVRAEINEEYRGVLEGIKTTAIHLRESLITRTDDSIRDAYITLIDEQTCEQKSGRKPDLNLIETAKRELMTAIVPHYTKMLQTFSLDLPTKTTTYLQQQGINLKKMPDEIFQQVAKFMAQDLANQSDIHKNNFIAGNWIDTMSRVIENITKILDKKPSN